MQKTPQKILVTGGSGFVGRALVHGLRETGAGVMTLARSHGDVRVDLGSSPDLSAVLSGCDAVVHLASRVHVMTETAVDPLAAYRAINVEATRHLARQAIGAGVPRFVFMSSIKVNGERTLDVRFTEHTSPRPEDPYGVSKFEAESALRDLAKQNPSWQLVILRPPLVYGPGVGANFRQLLRLVQTFPVLPFGKLNRKRSLIFVGNLVSSVMAALEPTAATGTFVVSDGRAIAVRELALLIAQTAGRRVWLAPIPLFLLKLVARLTGRAAQISRLTDALEVDSSGFERAFSWKPPFSLQDGLRATLTAPHQKVEET